ncbi:unnamed protein product [Closterium sp. Yama58-4]|nr:unnamed protein product [Closterium sp. Yama58-4]
MRSLVLVVAAIFTVFARFGVAAATETINYDCFTPCNSPQNAKDVVASCVEDCALCVATSSGCSFSFKPIWVDAANTGQVYQGGQCNKSCGLSWWSWLLIAISILLFVVLIAFIIYRCCCSKTNEWRPPVAGRQSRIARSLAMGGPAFDLLANPLGAVRVLFDREVHRLRSAAQTGGQGGGDGGGAQEAIKRQLAEGDWGVRTLADEFLFRDGNIDKVPEINSVGVDHVPVGSLVRFRGMVQDMWGTEFYQGLYKRSRQPPSASPSVSSAPPSPPWRTTKYTDGDCAGGMGGDGADGLGEAGSERVTDFGSIWERRLLYCVPCLDAEGRTAAGEATDSKRQATAAVTNTTGAANLTSSSNTPAQPSSTAAAGDTPPFVDLHFPLGPSAAASPHGHPLLPCIVKLYDSVESQVKLNQVVEFVGVVAPPSAPTVHTAHTAAHDEGTATTAGAAATAGAGTAMEVEMMGADMGMGACPSACLPSSQVLRLHCLTWRKLPDLFQPAMEPTVAAAGDIRAALLSRLAAALGGDRLAAEYLLLHLLSRVHTRIEPMPLGKLSLNLSGFPEPSSASTPSHPPPPLSSSPPSLSQAASPSLSALTSSLQTLLPATATLPLSLDTLNSRRLAPHKDYTSDRLVSGVLQLPAGTHLTIDETALKPGRVTALGSQNLRALKELLEWQKVDYDFQYYKMEMQSDIPVLILSHATSRLLPADVSLPVRCTAPPQPVREDEPDVATWRRYIGCCRLLDHEIKDDMREQVERELVAARQEDPSLDSDTFHRWLTLARLAAASFGERELSRERWQAVRDLEQAREARNRVV